MKGFVVSKCGRLIVLGSLAASLLMGAISASAWAASTDAIANTSPSVSTTSGQVHAMPDECPPLLQALLANSKLKGHGKIKCSPGSHFISLKLVRISSTPEKGQSPSSIPGAAPLTPNP